MIAHRNAGLGGVLPVRDTPSDVGSAQEAFAGASITNHCDVVTDGETVLSVFGLRAAHADAPRPRLE